MSKSIKAYLYSNVNLLIRILEYFRYSNININRDEIRCAKPNGTNYTVCCIKLTPQLSARDFSDGFSNDIYGLIGHHTGLSYSQINQYITNLIGVDNILVETNNNLFDGFYDNKTIANPIQEDILEKYPIEFLDLYDKVWNKRFADDNIKPSTQEYFKIGYDTRTQRITIPWFDIDGDLVGVMGRLNSDEETNCKYLPLIRFPKNLTLYNANNIQGEELYIFESEKSVMLASQYGYKNSVALGGNAISETQLNIMVEHLGMKRLIIGYDEGLDKEIINNNLMYLRKKLMFSDVQIELIYDKNNIVLPKGSKDSPTDLGKDGFITLLNHCRRRVI